MGLTAKNRMMPSCVVDMMKKIPGNASMKESKWESRPHLSVVYDDDDGVLFV